MIQQDWTLLSRFISCQVKERCRKKIETIKVADGNDVSKSASSLVSPRLSIGNSLKRLDMSQSLDSGIFDFEDEDGANIEDSIGVVAEIEITGYTQLVQSLADRKDVGTQIIARSIEAYYTMV